MQDPHLALKTALINMLLQVKAIKQAQQLEAVLTDHMPQIITAVHLDETLLSSCEVSRDFACLSEKTLRNFRHQGKGPPFIKLGRGKTARVYYKRADIHHWLHQQKTHPA